MNDDCQSLDIEDLGANRAAWLLLVVGGALGGMLIYKLLHHRPMDSATLFYLVFFWSAPAAGMTALITRLFYAGPDQSITIACRYRRWKLIWAALLLVVGTCTGAVALLSLWGLALWLGTMLL